MSRRSLSAALRGARLAGACAPAAADSRDPINGYRVKATPQNLEKLAHGRLRRHGGPPRRTVEIFGTAAGRQAPRRGHQGCAQRIASRPHRGAAPARRLGARVRVRPLGQPTTGLAVWTRYDTVRGRRQGAVPRAVRPAPAQYPKITKQETSAPRTWAGRSSRSRSPQRAPRPRTASRPSVLFNAKQHAREWLAGETCRRTLDYFVENYGDNARSPPGRQARAVVHVHLEPGRLRVHVHRRQPAVAQEHGRQRP